MSNLLELDHVTKLYPVGGLFSRKSIKAVNDVSFSLDGDKPEIFAIVGESGSGKSTIAKMMLGNEIPNSGRLVFDGVDISNIRNRAQREAFMAKVQPVFQNPFEAFNPLTRVDAYLFGTAHRFAGANTLQEKETLSDQALQRVGLSMAEIKGRFSHELSGGQLQRVAVARALIPSPKLIVADEPVSMVDASLRMSIVNLFRSLRDELKVSIIYITHDLATAYYISDRVIIMQKGVVIESGGARAVLDNPTHPYSIALKNAVLPPDPKAASAAIRLRGVRAAI
ncbi:ABC transporter ATP-binding protein [Devosia psychrophila]|jgi:peptide/nickel transport system ATP-binding protein|uniref:ABC transporter ATP-binding protein n=1 Tax=Devosia psychrophila TaxID=728005 RepID=A0A0F5PYW9_9HYPH|nr:ABC transporter ATP-binding protein [Devosia psychrophila]KKC33872.1 ABC transporter ATP-binding protein [Devosia psychrophila]SFD10541.1 peptide/nickel transport system ATP-binding protein [Devosia psychrophila]